MGDYNDANIIVGKHGMGVIDFGDCRLDLVVGDVASGLILFF